MGAQTEGLYHLPGAPDLREPLGLVNGRLAGTATNGVAPPEPPCANKGAFPWLQQSHAQEHGRLSSLDLCASQISADKARGRDGPVWRWKSPVCPKHWFGGFYSCFSLILLETTVWSTVSIYVSICLN